MTWLVETLAWTGALIALVLLLRRPVARHFGARAAYMLWALPLLRLALPPIVLPAAFAPAPERDALDAGVRTDVLDTISVVPASHAGLAAVDWGIVLLAAWLVGAFIYIALRLAAYHRLRRELLADARPMGAAGRVRLVESPATRSPLAFGVLDKVIALPPGFMAQADRPARDLALAHELSHHRAHDLAVNFAMLPLFALHWFNPLSRLGWSAMRRDQEAACDARVVKGCARAERARYAALIAGASAAPRFALAAPMACPALGDKSIVQRLRNLTMTDHSPRRRRAGGILVGVAALALPLTASFSYAQVAPEAAEVPVPPPPPAPPTPPEAPAAPDPLQVEIDRSAPGEEAAHRPRETVIVRRISSPEARAKGDGNKAIRQFIIRGKDGTALEPGTPEFDAKMRALEERLAKLDRDLPERVFVDRARIAQMVPRVIADCANGTGVSETRSDDGSRVIRVCQRAPGGHALDGLRAARSAIARNSEISAEARASVLAELDREIARIEGKD